MFEIRHQQQQQQQQRYEQIDKNIVRLLTVLQSDSNNQQSDGPRRIRRRQTTLSGIQHQHTVPISIRAINSTTFIFLLSIIWTCAVVVNSFSVPTQSTTTFVHTFSVCKHQQMRHQQQFTTIRNQYSISRIQQSKQQCFVPHDQIRKQSTTTTNLNLFPVEAIHDAASVMTTIDHQSTLSILVNHLSTLMFQMPFAELGRELSQSLDIGNTLSREIGLVPETTTTTVLNSMGYDVLVFLAASVIVTPLAKVVGITPILGYLIIGAILGPHGLDVFANSHADIELGDIGIMFLLFSEGLEVSSVRLQKLTNFLPLGLAQISLVTGTITAAFLLGVPQFFDNFLPLDSALIRIDTPVMAFILAFAGALSTSAFIFPVLKERGWEEDESGEAATSILLLQDLIVAPFLVLLPYLVGESETDYTAIGFLTTKAIVGFGAVMYIASLILRRIFNLVARTRSTETFVALCLLVAAGMGAAAKQFGLTDTAGAFAAGMLLANTNYRAQIQADILPFKGILLGIFFMDAGSTFDSELVLREFPTIIVGALGLLAFKIVTLGAATRVPRWMEPNRLSPADALKVTLLLAGGGEFAFVVLALSEKLELIPNDLGSILTAIVLITMGITPLLGIAADKLSQALNPEEEIVSIPGKLNGHTGTNGIQEHYVNGKDENGIINGNVGTTLGRDSIVVCGYGEIGRSLIRALDSEVDTYKKIRGDARTEGLNIVAFDIDEALVDSNLKPTEHSIVLYGNGCNSEVIRSSGISTPSAIFVAYEDHSRVLSATSRLRTTFRDTPIYARASIRAEVKALRKAGATEVVVEADEMPRAAPALIRGVWGGNLAGEYPTDAEQLRQAASAAAGVSLIKIDELLELFAAMDQNTSGLVTGRGIEDFLARSSNWIGSDEQIQKLDDWIQSTLKDSDPLDEIELCRLYGRAPDFVKEIFALPSDTKEKLQQQSTNQVVEMKD